MNKYKKKETKQKKYAAPKLVAYGNMKKLTAKVGTGKIDSQKRKS